MADSFSVTKGSIIEVSSDEPGFHGAWYVATVMDVVEASPTRKRSSSLSSSSTKKKKNIFKKKGYLVKYDTLFEEENLNEHLTEVVYPSFVRPLPPTPTDNAVEFKVDDVIDAYHRDGWWIGVIKKVITVDNESDKFVVAFENPPEEVVFQKPQLRVHLDWVDGSWLLPKNKTAEQELGDKIIPESNTTDPPSGFTTPLKRGRDPENQSAGPKVSARKRTHSPKKAERNGAVDGSATNIKNGTVDSVRKKSQSSAGGKGNPKVMVPVTETNGSEAIHQNLLLVDQEMITAEIPEAEDGKSQQTKKRGRPAKLQVTRPNGLQQENEKAWERDSSAFHENTTDLDEEPLCVWYQGLLNRSVLKRSSCCSPPDHQRDEPNVTLNHQATGGTTTDTDYQQKWPFIKRSPVWATIECLESYKKPPQNPHFSPLKKIKEDFREGLAIAHMVTFANMLQRISNLQVTDSNEIITNSLETLVDLESHGFDVGRIRGRLTELLDWKLKVSEHKDKLQTFEKELEKCNVEKSQVEEEMKQVEVKIQELQEKMVGNVKTKKLKDEEIAKLQSNMHLVSNEIMDWENTIEKLVATPL